LGGDRGRAREGRGANEKEERRKECTEKDGGGEKLVCSLARSTSSFSIGAAAAALLFYTGVTSTHLSAPCQNVLSVISFSFSLLMLLEGGGKGRKLF
jgi:hypothetical protein